MRFSTVRHVARMWLETADTDTNPIAAQYAAEQAHRLACKAVHIAYSTVELRQAEELLLAAAAKLDAFKPSKES